MNDRRSDLELLRAFFRRADQQAFTVLARRHVGIVYATARRKVGDEGAAQEIVQNVFVALARKSWHFGPDDSVLAWLYKAALLEAKNWLRADLRRRRREQLAVNLGTTMNTQSGTSLDSTLLDAIDDGLISLREKDRSVLLLRFYNGHSLSEVAASLGVREDAARKRVAVALAKLTTFLQRRGIRSALAATATAALQETAQSAPAVANMALLTKVPIMPPFGFAAKLLAPLTGLSHSNAIAICASATLLFGGLEAYRTQSVRHKAKAFQEKVAVAQERSADVAERLARLNSDYASLLPARRQATNSDPLAQAAFQNFRTLQTRSRNAATRRKL